MSRRTRWLAFLAGFALLVPAAGQVAAYGPQVPYTITVSPASSTITCERPTAVFATVLDIDGLPIKDVIVTWSFSVSPSSDDRFLQPTSKTNKDGVARTNVKLACVAGDRTITASVGDVHGSAVVQVDLDRPGRPAGGVLGSTGRPQLGTIRLPATETVAVEAQPVGGLPVPAIPAIPLALAMLIGSAVVLRRVLGHR